MKRSPGVDALVLRRLRRSVSVTVRGAVPVFVLSGCLGASVSSHAGRLAVLGFAVLDHVEDGIGGGIRMVLGVGDVYPRRASGTELSHVTAGPTEKPTLTAPPSSSTLLWAADPPWTSRPRSTGTRASLCTDGERKRNPSCDGRLNSEWEAGYFDAALLLVT